MASEPESSSFLSPGELTEIIKSLNTGESDRGAALVGAALLDDLLSELLKAFFVDDPKRVSFLLGLKQDGPLGSFSSRIKISYLLGLISTDTRDDLDRIRDIRNRFAHSRIPLSFEDHKIKSWCDNLSTSSFVHQVMYKKITQGKGSDNPRLKFVISCTTVFVALRGGVLATKHIPTRVDFDRLKADS